MTLAAAPSPSWKGEEEERRPVVEVCGVEREGEHRRRGRSGDATTPKREGIYFSTSSVSPMAGRGMGWKGGRGPPPVEDPARQGGAEMGLGRGTGGGGGRTLTPRRRRSGREQDGGTAPPSYYYQELPSTNTAPPSVDWEARRRHRPSITFEDDIEKGWREEDRESRREEGGGLHARQEREGEVPMSFLGHQDAAVSRGWGLASSSLMTEASGGPLQFETTPPPSNAMKSTTFFPTSTVPVKGQVEDTPRTEEDETPFAATATEEEVDENTRYWNTLPDGPQEQFGGIKEAPPLPPPPPPPRGADAGLGRGLYEEGEMEDGSHEGGSGATRSYASSGSTPGSPSLLPLAVTPKEGEASCSSVLASANVTFSIPLQSSSSLLPSVISSAGGGGTAGTMCRIALFIPGGRGLVLIRHDTEAMTAEAKQRRMRVQTHGRGGSEVEAPLHVLDLPGSRRRKRGGVGEDEEEEEEERPKGASTAIVIVEEVSWHTVLTGGAEVGSTEATGSRRGVSFSTSLPTGETVPMTSSGVGGGVAPFTSAGGTSAPASRARSTSRTREPQGSFRTPSFPCPPSLPDEAALPSTGPVVPTTAWTSRLATGGTSAGVGRAVFRPTSVGRGYVKVLSTLCQFAKRLTEQALLTSKENEKDRKQFKRNRRRKSDEVVRPHSPTASSHDDEDDEEEEEEEAAFLVLPRSVSTETMPSGRREERGPPSPVGGERREDTPPCGFTEEAVQALLDGLGSELEDTLREVLKVLFRESVRHDVENRPAWGKDVKQGLVRLLLPSSLNIAGGEGSRASTSTPPLPFHPTDPSAPAADPASNPAFQPGHPTTAATLARRKSSSSFHHSAGAGEEMEAVKRGSQRKRTTTTEVEMEDEDGGRRGRDHTYYEFLRTPLSPPPSSSSAMMGEKGKEGEALEGERYTTHASAMQHSTATTTTATTTAAQVGAPPGYILDPLAAALPPPLWPMAHPPPEILFPIQQLLCAGEREAAVAEALRHGLYTDALIISLVCPTPAALQHTVDVYTTQCLHPVTPLAQAYRSFNSLPCWFPAHPPLTTLSTLERNALGCTPGAGWWSCRGPSSALALRPPPIPLLSHCWRSHAAFHLSNFTHHSIDYLLRLADALAQSHDIQAAHTCLLLCVLYFVFRRTLKGKAGAERRYGREQDEAMRKSDRHVLSYPAPGPLHTRSDRSMPSPSVEASDSFGNLESRRPQEWQEEVPVEMSGSTVLTTSSSFLHAGSPSVLPHDDEIRSRPAMGNNGGGAEGNRGRPSTSHTPHSTTSSAMAFSSVPVKLTKAEERRLAQREALSQRLGLLGGMYYTRRRAGFLSPLTVVLTTLLQVCRRGLLEQECLLREMEEEEVEGPRWSGCKKGGRNSKSRREKIQRIEEEAHGEHRRVDLPFACIPARQFRYSVSLQVMLLWWLREAGGEVARKHLLDGPFSMSMSVEGGGERSEISHGLPSASFSLLSGAITEGMRGGPSWQQPSMGTAEKDGTTIQCLATRGMEEMVTVLTQHLPPLPWLTLPHFTEGEEVSSLPMMGGPSTPRPPLGGRDPHGDEGHMEMEAEDTDEERRLHRTSTMHPHRRGDPLRGGGYSSLTRMLYDTFGGARVYQKLATTTGRSHSRTRHPSREDPLPIPIKIEETEGVDGGATHATVEKEVEGREDPRRSRYSSHDVGNAPPPPLSSTPSSFPTSTAAPRPSSHPPAVPPFPGAVVSPTTTTTTTVPPPPPTPSSFSSGPRSRGVAPGRTLSSAKNSFSPLLLGGGEEARRGKASRGAPSPSSPFGVGGASAGGGSGMPKPYKRLGATSGYLSSPFGTSSSPPSTSFSMPVEEDRKQPEEAKKAQYETEPPIGHDAMARHTTSPSPMSTQPPSSSETMSTTSTKPSKKENRTEETRDGSSRKRGSSFDTIRQFFSFRGRSESSGTSTKGQEDGTEDGKKGEKKEIKKMIIDTEKPPQFDPATGRWMFELTEEEKLEAEKIKQGPPKPARPLTPSTTTQTTTTSPSSTPGGGKGMGPTLSTPGGPTRLSTPSSGGATVDRQTPSAVGGGEGGAGGAVGIGAVRRRPGGLQRRPGGGLRPQYADMFNQN